MNSRLKSSEKPSLSLFIYSLLTGIFLSSFLNLSWINPANAEEKSLRTLTVTGQGIETIPTTITQISLGVEIQGKTAAEVQQEVANRTSAIINFLDSRNVKQLQTTGIQLQPNYDYNNQQRRLIGYVGTNTLSFRVKTEQIGDLLDESVKVGATRIDGVSFPATEEVISEAQKEALRKATLDAQQQADTVLKTLNFNAKEVVNIQINGANPPEPRLYQVDQFAKAASPVSTPVIGGEQKVQASVTLQISY